MAAEILCVGTELLLGNITNGNARWLAEQPLAQQQRQARQRQRQAQPCHQPRIPGVQQLELQRWPEQPVQPPQEPQEPPAQQQQVLPAQQERQPELQWLPEFRQGQRQEQQGSEPALQRQSLQSRFRQPAGTVSKVRSAAMTSVGSRTYALGRFLID